MEFVAWFDNLGTVLAVIPPVLALITAVGGLVLNRADARLRARRDDLICLLNEDRAHRVTGETRKVAQEAAEFMTLVLAERGRRSAARVSKSFVKGFVRNLVVFGVLAVMMAAVMVWIGIVSVQQGDWLVGCLLISYSGIIGFAWIGYFIDGRRVRTSTQNLRQFAESVSSSTPLMRLDAKADAASRSRMRADSSSRAK